MSRTDLSRFDNSDYRPGHPIARVMWYLASMLFFTHAAFPFMGFKRSILRLFGARIGRELIIKPRVRIKYPWKLHIGNHCWIGEDVWIDNLDEVRLGDHCCLSQGALLLSGNHDYKRPTFDLMVKPIILEDGVWIGAKATVVQGVTCHSHAVLGVGSVANNDLQAYTIYAGVPAEAVRPRKMLSE